MSFKVQVQALVFVLLSLVVSQAFALKPIGARIEVVPSSNFNFEFGLIYSNTGLLPARLVLLCEHQVSEPDWDGIVPSPAECGSADLQVRVRAFGLLLFLSNYLRDNPLTIGIHVDPTSASIRSVLGTYIGGLLGAGVVAGGRTMVFVNQDSGVWATVTQAMRPGSKEGPKRGRGFDVGVDIGIPRMQVYLKSSRNLDMKLASLINQNVAAPLEPPAGPGRGTPSAQKKSVDSEPSQGAAAVGFRID